MIRLSKKIEYAILALQYIAGNQDKIVSAKEISDKLNISFDFLSKTLQTLIKRGIVNSLQGIKGGYSLEKKPEEITIGEVIEALEGKTSLVECFIGGDDSSCNRTVDCTIRVPMKRIQNKINNVLYETTIAELVKIN